MIFENKLSESTFISIFFFKLIYSEEAEALAKKLKLRFYRTSVKEDLNVNEGKLPFKKLTGSLFYSSYAFSIVLFRKHF